jgi:hypothetical protein
MHSIIHQRQSMATDIPELPEITKPRPDPGSTDALVRRYRTERGRAG